jgi:aminodeoxyfutalosine deaminase
MACCLNCPPLTRPCLRQWFTFTDFNHFIVVYLTIQNMLRTPEDFDLIAYECGADMAAQNIRYRELTVTPYTHTDFQAKFAHRGVVGGIGKRPCPRPA